MSRAAEVPARVYYLLEGMTKVYTSNAGGYIRLLGYHQADTICVLDGLRACPPERTPAAGCWPKERPGGPPAPPQRQILLLPLP